MATVEIAPPQTIAELVDRLDNVPLERIRLVPPPGTATQNDLLKLLEQAKKTRCELVDATLLEKTVGWDESDVAARILFAIMLFTKEHGLGGRAVGGDGPYRMADGNVRLPDVSYTRAERVPPTGQREPVAQWVPDLAVEVLSASNTPGEMARKLDEYFTSGVRLVWYVDLPSRSVRVFTAPDVVTELGPDGALDGGDVLPGFSLSIRELFESE